MQSKIHHRIAVLIAAGMIGSGLVGSAFAASASASTSTVTADDNGTCTAYEGKYDPRLVTTYQITGGNDSEHGVPGGTLQLWASDICGTAWVKTVKLAAYADRPLFTVAGIASFADPQKRSETVTSADLESPAVATGRRSGELHVEGGFIGGNYQFDSAHTFKY